MTYKLRKWLSYLQVKWKYRNRPYSEYYAAVMKVRTKVDPQFAVGGLWDEIGQLQFDFLRAKGLLPRHKLLDFGCGSLRGGGCTLSAAWKRAITTASTSAPTRCKRGDSSCVKPGWLTSSPTCN